MGIYSFGSDKGWVIANIGGLYYWEWTKETNSWSSAHLISSSGGYRPRVLQTDENTIYVYVESSGSVRYVKSTDGGQTWGSMINTGISSTGDQVSFKRYGDTYFMITYDGTYGISLRTSSDGVSWGNRQTIYDGNPSGYYGPNLLILDEDTILWTATEKNTVDSWGFGWREHFGSTFDIAALDAGSGKPDSPDPVNNSVLPPETHSVYLNVTAHGSETMDVAFYWANGTFIGVDKLVNDG